MFEKMKAWLASPEAKDYQFSYDDPYADYVRGIYGKAEKEVGKMMNDADIFIEPSVQEGMGVVFMNCNNGSTSWDFETECDILLEFAEEADSEEEFKQAIVDFLLDIYKECADEENEPDDEE